MGVGTPVVRLQVCSHLSGRTRTATATAQETQSVWASAQLLWLVVEAAASGDPTLSMLGGSMASIGGTITCSV